MSSETCGFSATERCLLEAINTLAAELKETRAELEELKKRVPGG